MSIADPAIRVNNIGKRYQIGRIEKYKSLRESLVRAAFSPWRKIRQLFNPGGFEDLDSIFWALKDVSFEIEHGEVVGIIGRNGAGKSTLLKILSHITEPSAGRVEIRGRVGSLLEVGTGFHPELTGRENIYLNGAILGMKRAEISRRFDEIVAFSEVEKFLDTQVKHYSSGMYMKLAFAVAAHLEQEILLVDEVLAVGDALFQKKCLGRMGSIAQVGRTVLLVSHNMNVIRNLCKRTILLSEGRLETFGPTEDVVSRYMACSEDARTLEQVAGMILRLPCDSDFSLLKVNIRQDGSPCVTVNNGKPVEVEIEYELKNSLLGFRVYVDLCDDTEVILIRTFHDDDADVVTHTGAGRYLSVVTIPADFLAPCDYMLVVNAGIFNVRGCMGSGVPVRLKVMSTSGVNRAYPNDTIRSKLQPRLSWSTRKV